MEYQLAEIPIGKEQNALLVPGCRQDILIRKTRRVLARDGRHVMAKRAKVGNQPEIGQACLHIRPGQVWMGS
jgi:hypothetical protein